jgi:hypothetical protein
MKRKTVMRTWLLAGWLLLAPGLAGCAQGPVAIRAEPNAVASKPPPPPGVVALAEKLAGPEEAPAAAGSFAFPADQGGKLLEQRLKPADRLPPLEEGPTQPRPRSVPAAIGLPQVPLPGGPVELARLSPLLPSNPVRPRALPDEPPLARNREEPTSPQRLELPTAALVRLPQADGSQPVPLPLLGQAVPDREPLTDPTTAASIQAALAAIPPARTTPAPFVRESLPDPFENSAVIKVRTPPAESSTPYTASPRRPGP